MNRPSVRPRWIWRTPALASTLALALLAGACSSDSTDPSDDASVTFAGVVASPSVTGTVEVTVESASLASASLAVAAAPGWSASAAATAEVTASGTLHITGGATVQLTGTYNTTTHELSLSGGGYSLTGTYADGRLDGTFTTPTDSGEFTLQSSDEATIRNYCGTFEGEEDDGYLNLTWNLETNEVTGIGVSSLDQGTVRLTGTVSGSTLSLTYPINGDQGGPTGTATGTITSTSFEGTFDSAGEDGGTFSGTVCE